MMSHPGGFDGPYRPRALTGTQLSLFPEIVRSSLIYDDGAGMDWAREPSPMIRGIENRIDWLHSQGVGWLYMYATGGFDHITRHHGYTVNSVSVWTAGRYSFAKVRAEFPNGIRQAVLMDVYRADCIMRLIKLARQNWLPWKRPGLDKRKRKR